MTYGRPCLIAALLALGVFAIGVPAASAHPIEILLCIRGSPDIYYQFWIEEWSRNPTDPSYPLTDLHHFNSIGRITSECQPVPDAR